MAQKESALCLHALPPPHNHSPHFVTPAQSSAGLSCYKTVFCRASRTFTHDPVDYHKKLHTCVLEYAYFGEEKKLKIYSVVNVKSKKYPFELIFFIESEITNPFLRNQKVQTEIIDIFFQCRKEFYIMHLSQTLLRQL